MRQDPTLGLPFLVNGVSFPFVGALELVKDGECKTAVTRSFPMVTKFVLFYFSLVQINQELLNVVGGGGEWKPIHVEPFALYLGKGARRLG